MALLSVDGGYEFAGNLHHRLGRQAGRRTAGLFTRTLSRWRSHSTHSPGRHALPGDRRDTRSQTVSTHFQGITAQAADHPLPPPGDDLRSGRLTHKPFRGLHLVVALSGSVSQQGSWGGSEVEGSMGRRVKMDKACTAGMQRCGAGYLHEARVKRTNG